MKEWSTREHEPRRWSVEVEFAVLLAGQLLGLAALFAWVLG
jgi:hypothetical protein